MGGPAGLRLEVMDPRLSAAAAGPFLQVGRVISQRGNNTANRRYLVKWAGLEYSDSTWETKEEIRRDKKGRVSAKVMQVCHL